MKKINGEKLSWINRLHAWHKLVISVCAGTGIYYLVPVNGLSNLSHIMLSWDCAIFLLIVLSWITFFTIKPEQIREQCKKQDEKRVVTFLLILMATIASFTAVVSLLANRAYQVPRVPIAIIGMSFSWILVHTIFTMRYTHLYYGNDKTDASTHAGGLEFPGDKKPNYVDFAYFSFVVGMTFQVSDVQITSKRLRQLVLLHGLISFVFNTFIVALTINLIAGLSEK